MPTSTEPRTWGTCRGCGNARDLERCLMCDHCVRTGVPIPKIGTGYGDGEDVEIVRAERDRLRAENEALKAEALEACGIVYGQLTAGVVDDHDRIMRACNELAEFGRRLTGEAPPLKRSGASDETQVPE